MDNSSVPKLSFLDKAKIFIIKNLKYIIVILIIIIILCVTFLTSYYFRNLNTVLDMDNKYNKLIIDQTNFCTENLKKFRVCDFYINSSSNIGLVGNNKLDYISLDIIPQVIRAGVKFFNIEIFNETQNNNTNPVVSSGYSKGDWKLTNFIPLDIFLKKIIENCFSEQLINNYMDPIFLYLDIKVNDNIDTLDKIYNIINNTCGARLLSSSYNYQGVNIAVHPVCNLMKKIVLMSNKSYSEHKLGRIINCSLENVYLQRVGYSKLLNPVNNDENLTNTDPIAKITAKVSFLKTTVNQYYIQFDNNINLIDLGFNTKLLYKISGSKKQINNTGINLITFEKIYQNRIFLNKNENFEVEEDVEITIRGFKFKVSNSTNFVEFNKNKLTIIYNDHIDFDPEVAWNKGCQFVQIDYQYQGINTEKGLNKFKDGSIILKPDNLRRRVIQNKNKSLNELYPEPTIGNKYDIDYNFYEKAKYEISIHPYTQSNTRLINDNGVAKFSINYNNTNSVFTVIKGLNGKPDSMSIKIGDNYLVSKDNCCYLTFKPLPNENLMKLFKDNASFYPIKSINNKKETFSIVTTKDIEYINNKGSGYTGFNYKIPHYIKYRSKFNPKNKIYSKNTTDFKKIATLESSTGIITFWRAYKDTENNFYPLGDYVTTEKNPKINGILVNGFTQHPVDYELIWENKGSSESYKISIWKPIPPDGFIALGCLVNRSYKKPSVKLVKCVGGDYVNEIELGKMIWDNKGTTDKDTVSLWNIPGHNLFLASPSFFKPNEFDSPVFNIIDKELDYNDRLYLSKRISSPGEDDTLCFKVKSISENFNDDYLKLNLENIDNLNKNIIRDDYKIKHKFENICINYPGALWSPILNNNNSDDLPSAKNINDLKEKVKNKINPNPTIKDPLNIDKCKNNKYEGTNFIYGTDNTIRFQNNTDYCLTANLDSNSQPITTKHGLNLEDLQKRFGNNTNLITQFLGDRKQNVVTLQKCRPDLKGQKFNYSKDGTIKYGGIETYDSDTCISNRDNTLRIEECRERNKKQLWDIKAVASDDDCLSKGIFVYILVKHPRGVNNFNSSTMPDIEDYDTDNFHLYCKGEIHSKMNSFWFVDLANGQGLKAAKENSDEIIIDKIPEPSQLKIGTKVIARNGGLTINGFKEEDVMWIGMIIKKINMGKYIVLFDKNSIELNESRDSLGRSRTPQIKEIKINNLRLLKSSASCN